MPKPVLQAMVLADHIYQDRATGKFIIAGTFSTVVFGQSKISPAGEFADDPEHLVITGPVTQSGSPYLYLALVEVHGEVPVTLKFVDLSDASVLFEGQLVLAALDPVAVAEYIVPLPPLPATAIGNYSLDLVYDGEILGSWRVSVRKVESSGEPGAES